MIILILQVRWFCKLPKATQLVWAGQDLCSGTPSLLLTPVVDTCWRGTTSLDPKSEALVLCQEPSRPPVTGNQSHNWQMWCASPLKQDWVLCGGDACLGLVLEAVPRACEHSPHILCAFLSLLLPPAFLRHGCDMGLVCSASRFPGSSMCEMNPQTALLTPAPITAICRAPHWGGGPLQESLTFFLLSSAPYPEDRFPVLVYKFF